MPEEEECQDLSFEKAPKPGMSRSGQKTPDSDLSSSGECSEKIINLQKGLENLCIKDAEQSQTELSQTDNEEETITNDSAQSDNSTQLDQNRPTESSSSKHENEKLISANNLNCKENSKSLLVDRDRGIGEIQSNGKARHIECQGAAAGPQHLFINEEFRMFNNPAENSQLRFQLRSVDQMVPMLHSNPRRRHADRGKISIYLL